jgi:hypothetical protein
MRDTLLCVPEVKYTETSAQFIPGSSGHFVFRNKSTPSVLGYFTCVPEVKYYYCTPIILAIF